MSIPQFATEPELVDPTIAELTTESVVEEELETSEDLDVEAESEEDVSDEPEESDDASKDEVELEEQDSDLDDLDADVESLEAFSNELTKGRVSKFKARNMIETLDRINSKYELTTTSKVSLEEFPPLTSEVQQQESVRNFKDTEPLVETINCYIVQLRQNKLKQIGTALSRLTPFVESLQVLIAGVVSEAKSTCGLLENASLVLDKPSGDTVSVVVTSFNKSLPSIPAITQEMAFHVSSLIERLSIVETTLESVFTKIPVHDLQGRLEKTNFGRSERWCGDEATLEFPVSDLATVKDNLEHFEKFTSYLQLEYLKETIDRIGSAINTMLENAVEPEFAVLMDVINNLTGIRFLSVPLMSVHGTLEFLESHLKVQQSIADQWLRKDVANEDYVMRTDAGLQETYLNPEWLSQRTLSEGTVQVSAFPSLANNYNELHSLLNTQLVEDQEQLRSVYEPEAKRIIATVYEMLGKGSLDLDILRSLQVPRFKPFPFPQLEATGVPETLSMVSLPALTGEEVTQVANVLVQLRGLLESYLVKGLGETWVTQLMDVTPAGLVSKFSLTPRVDGSLSVAATKLPELVKDGTDMLLVQRQFALVNRFVEEGYQYFITNRKNYIDIQCNLIAALQNWLEASVK